MMRAAVSSSSESSRNMIMSIVISVLWFIGYIMIMVISLWQCNKSSHAPPAKKKDKPLIGGGGGLLGSGGLKKKGETTDPITSPGQTLSSAQLKVVAPEPPKKIQPEVTKDKEAKSIMKPQPVIPVEQPTQPMVSQKDKRSKSVVKDINAMKDVKPQNPKPSTPQQQPPPNQQPLQPKSKENTKSLAIQSTQFSIRSTMRESRRSDECTDRFGTPEVTVDKTQRSISLRIADDEDTNDNIEELPMDEHKSE